MKFTGSFRHLFERVEKKRIPPPPNRHITGATTGVFSASTKRKRSGRQGAPCLDAGLSAHVPRVRAMKNPARFPGPGLGHTPEGYLFILESRFNVQKSQVAQGSQVARRMVVFGIPGNICWAPRRWRPSNENPGAVSRPGPRVSRCSGAKSCRWRRRSRRSKRSRRLTHILSGGAMARRVYIVFTPTHFPRRR